MSKKYLIRVVHCLVAPHRSKQKNRAWCERAVKLTKYKIDTGRVLCVYSPAWHDQLEGKRVQASLHILDIVDAWCRRPLWNWQFSGVHLRSSNNNDQWLKQFLGLLPPLWLESSCALCYFCHCLDPFSLFPTLTWQLTIVSFLLLVIS